MTEDVIKIGEYIIIQKQNYKKLHKLNKPNSSVTLGRDGVNLSGIEGCPYFSVFRMIPSSKKGREYRLELTDEAVELKDEIDIRASGMDNRNIIDDGRSQKLSAAEIAEITNDASKAADIVETLISNSNTFHNKTEFSQEKYLKKKEKKYFEYVQILRPNLRFISEIMYRLDPGKIQYIRMDTLSQIITLSNIHSEGVHLLYDSGSNGLVAAALLSAIGANTNGKLVHMHPGNMSQKQALLAMNFSEEQNNRCISVNIYSVLRQYYQGCDTHDAKEATESTEPNPLKRKAESDEHKSKIPKLDVEASNDDKEEENGENKNGIEVDTVQNTENDKPAPKKPKWHFDNITASELLTQKVDSLVIACKEDPLHIFNELLPFVKAGRPFVVYYSVAEPLQNLYIELKSNPRVVALKLTCNWMRNYQVLPERTHPEVMMNNQSGFLLTGYVLK
ncbi:tRNA (adenine(58)-N(1))-methyltransferase non-catalytic subunit TRM6 [Pectinophora gossypiella]|uniref:tRNA (adenine(58)-N(1))-methyltransferase non-catalytic subunit TRM6 n=1 Tax=Pectinophora gossypiella TaxID=13191 RepID=UPI00214E00D6|nr:tRNA (adenine(58)-N(1))-methyltransferase non-catalytic subunit TRM6 [Pectinophora gossypiella]XP_049887965.1 tRNA (adenine(58)-N(1))-methyltransferase non-catalytic subunit TRM6 [Pectinophora gossypiella]XP_049887967.1 tRNA (adenine(58)-N(1))-methyltransferase non-catalytic subunit TRM6 [Pectinophora gossypiella]